MGIIVDTCVWIDVERGRLSSLDVSRYTGNEPVFMSPVTVAELTYGVERAADAGIKQRRVSALERLKKKPILLIDEETGVTFGRLSAALQSQGRGAEFRVQDIWIASQAIQHGFPVLTKNKKGFQDIPGLDLIVIGSDRM